MLPECKVLPHHRELEPAVISRGLTACDGEKKKMADGGASVYATDFSVLWAHYGGKLKGAALATLLVTLVLVYQSLQRKKLPRGPRPWPIVGNFPALYHALPHRALQKLATKYGDLMYLRLGSVPCIVVSSAAVAQEIVRTNDTNFSSRPKGLAFSVLSNNYRNMAIAPYGPYWRQLRKISNTELFSSKRHASYQSCRTEEIHTMMRVLLDDSKKGIAVNLRSWLSGVFANNMTRMLINKRYFGSGEKDQQEKEECMLMLKRIVDAVGAFIISDFVPYLSFITKLQGWQAKLEDLSEFTAKVTGKMFEIENHRQRAKERGHDEKYVPDFVDVLLATPLQDGKPLPDKDLRLVLLDMLTGGTETTATTVEWAMAELMLRPNLTKRAQDELDVVVGTDRLVQESDIPNLPYLQAIIKETFRLHPPLPLDIPRESLQESEVLGYKFPAHTRLIFNTYAIHRDPSKYETPDEFNPDRFVDHPEINHTTGYDSYQLIPFGVGRRMCPGYNLGNLMVTLTLANLLHSFDWSLPEEGQLDMSEVFSLVLYLKNPLCLVANPRSPAFLY